MAKKAHTPDSLWNYFSGYEYDSRVLEKIGLMNDDEYIEFIKAYCAEKNISLPKDYFSFIPQELSKFIQVRPEFKKPINLLAHAMLPLQIKRLELGKNLVSKDTKEEFFADIKKNIKTAKFKTNKEFRWSVYLSLISGTVKALEDEKNTEGKSAYTAACKKAKTLNTELRKIIKGVGEYFLSQETVWFTRDDDEGNLQPAFSNISKLFDSSVSMLSKDDIWKKEKDIINLAAKAVIWHPSKAVDEKVGLFDAVIDLKDRVDTWKDIEDSEPHVWEEKLKREAREAKADKIQDNMTYSSLTGAGVCFDLFYNLGLIDSKELMAMTVAWALTMHQISKAQKGEAQEQQPEEAPEDMEGMDPDEANPEVKKETIEGSSDFQIPLSPCQLRQIAIDISERLKEQDCFKNFDLKTGLKILGMISPIVFLKVYQLDDYYFTENSARDLRREKFRYRKPLAKWNDLQKMVYLSAFICSTVQDLEDEKTPHSIKDAKDTQGNLERILEGVPEYWFRNYLDRINYTFAQKGTDADLNCAKVILDDVSQCFDADDFSFETKDLPARLSEMKNLACLAICINPKWDVDEKDEFLDNVESLGIKSVPHIVIKHSRPDDNRGEEKTHE